MVCVSRQAEARFPAGVSRFPARLPAFGVVFGPFAIAQQPLRMPAESSFADLPDAPTAQAPTPQAPGAPAPVQANDPDAVSPNGTQQTKRMLGVVPNFPIGFGGRATAAAERQRLVCGRRPRQLRLRILHPGRGASRYFAELRLIPGVSSGRGWVWALLLGIRW